jgi:hypothetical protein
VNFIVHALQNKTVKQTWEGRIEGSEEVSLAKGRIELPYDQEDTRFGATAQEFPSVRRPAGAAKKRERGGYPPGRTVRVDERLLNQMARTE